MNAHNEQQALPCPFCGREPDLSFNSVSCGCAASPFIDREDALQVWNTRAAQPAAAQEAVVWQWRCPRADTDWSDCDKSLYDELRKAIGGEAGEMNGLRYEVRALYAAPVAPGTAAPANSLSPLARIADAFGVTGTWDQIADAVIARSTPAAPGIDLKAFREPVAFWFEHLVNHPYTETNAARLREAKRLQAWIDASPKSACHPDDAAVDAFAAAMKAKLADARAKGRSGWNGDEPGMQQRLSDMLRAHVEKGDPRDVANFCMFLHQRGEWISAPAPIPRPMDTAPRDGTVVRLLVQFEEHPIKGTDEDEPEWTIGACNDDCVPEDERTGWQVAGWCWDHDHFTEGKGTPVGWLPMLDSPKDERVSNPDELAFAARGFLSASFAPSAEESTREMRDTYSYWHRRLLRAAGGAMDYEQAADTAADSSKGGSEAVPGELRVWGTHKPGMMPKLFGDRDVAELNWYPEEGRDLICMQVVERVRAQAGDAEVQP